MDFSVGFGPGEFSWIMFGFEVFVTFGTTEFENFAIITNESHSMTWIGGARTKITLFDSHFNN